MISNMQKKNAKIFSNMHKENKMFVLPNAWSAGSAYVFEKQGFKAVATSSAGVAFDLGYPDGEDVSFEDLLNVVERITKCIQIPLSVDFERGYGKDVSQVKENARKLLLAGAVGFNIEDGLPDGKLCALNELIDKIKAISELKEELDLDFVINARTCAYWLNVAGEEEKLQIALERGNAFAQAGADCVFIPGAVDETLVAKFVKGINAPVNIILNGGYSDFKGLEKLGVRRLSLGSGPARYIFDKIIDMAEDVKLGKVDELISCKFNYAKANEYFMK